LRLKCYLAEIKAALARSSGNRVSRSERSELAQKAVDLWQEVQSHGELPPGDEAKLGEMQAVLTKNGDAAPAAHP